MNYILINCALLMTLGILLVILYHTKKVSYKKCLLLSTFFCLSITGVALECTTKKIGLLYVAYIFGGALSIAYLINNFTRGRKIQP